VDHLAELLAEIAPVAGAVEDVGHARADAELQVAQLDADLLQRADAADIEDAKIRHFKPLLPVMARGFLESVEEIYAELGLLRLEFEEARAGERLGATGLVGGEPHDPPPPR